MIRIFGICFLFLFVCGKGFGQSTLISFYDYESGKMGYKNEDGKVVISPVFNLATEFSEGFATVNIDDDWYMINEKGDVFFDRGYQELSTFSEGLCAFKKNGKYGFIDSGGRVIISPKYENVLWFSESLCPVYNNGKWGYIDKKGDVVINLVYNDVAVFSEGLAFVQGFGGKYGVINQSQNVIIPFVFEDRSHFQNGVALVQRLGRRKIAFEINKLGKCVWNCEEIEDIYHWYRAKFSYYSGKEKIVTECVSFKSPYPYYIATPQFDPIEIDNQCPLTWVTMTSGFLEFKNHITKEEFLISGDMENGVYLNGKIYAHGENVNDPWAIPVFSMNLKDGIVQSVDYLNNRRRDENGLISGMIGVMGYLLNKNLSYSDAILCVLEFNLEEDEKYLKTVLNYLEGAKENGKKFEDGSLLIDYLVSQIGDKEIENYYSWIQLLDCLMK